VEGMGAIDKPRSTRCFSRKFDGGLDGLRSRVGEANLFKERRVAEQPFGEDPGQWRNVHLHKIGKVARENARERLAKPWMVSANPEYAPTAQQV
jgi:hypothetical protein